MASASTGASNEGICAEDPIATVAYISETPVADFLRGIFQVQERRAGIYNDMKRSFAESLATGDDVAYNARCREFTQQFNECSQQVLEIERGLTNSALVEVIRSMQEYERTKLQMTCTLQVLKKAYNEQVWEWQQGEVISSDVHQRVYATPQSVPPAPATGSPAVRPRALSKSWKRCSCKGPNCTEQVEEPTQEEYFNAVSEATQGLEDVVNKVNEILEELRYEMESEE
mmetsp:Transcript_36504/g.70033  ORF Transcript_36504/g.70033 Transcript_36504/m.70033 type:complete len:229 (-) Transcript_36504:318-1004(-)|eukprot:CAMPEP_0114225236 /NCGR_PEP_ID=MMETSP0058-20121206/551_1 /TAXON_ID=36894 /ORGANISM="Pyramimonas parkeae, CCMP726" /LENGTH=228 /DNA_ID=CAMNT_0001335801 /DNA_START=423 /DNA_END=1109 /DNA_ORIENTATION=+